jgi:ATP-dependent 26S proteasome regulatory subunit
MLNALDGALANNQGLTIVMTTNRYARLMRDEFRATREALFRPGRVDLQARPILGKCCQRVRKVLSLHTRRWRLTCRAHPSYTAW